MTAITYEIPPSLRERIAEWLGDNPGWHGGADIQDGIRLMESRHAVYNELGRMARRGEVERRREDAGKHGARITVYRLAP